MCEPSPFTFLRFTAPDLALFARVCASSRHVVVIYQRYPLPLWLLLAN